MNNKSWNYYRAFGLSIRSDIAFGDLVPTEGPGHDVTISLSGIEDPFEDTQNGFNFDFSGETQILSWKAVGKFRIRGMNLIEVDPLPGIDESIIALPLFGIVFSTLMHVRGDLVLHASAVAIEEAGIAFLGDKGAGKSTTASRFLNAGYKLISDDVVRIVFSYDGPPQVHPGFGQVKLWEDAASQISFKNTDGGTIMGTQKRKLLLDGQFRTSPASLRSIYILDRGQNPGIVALPRPEALQALVRFSYLSRYGSNVFNRNIRSRHLINCAQAAEHVRVNQLIVAPVLDELSDIVSLVEADMPRQCA